MRSYSSVGADPVTVGRYGVTGYGVSVYGRTAARSWSEVSQ